MKNIPTRARLRAVLLTLSLLSQAAVSFAQQQQPQRQPADEEEVVRLNTELVQLRAVVTDRKGQPVENLRKEDFEVLENGQPRDISFFSLERAPVSPGAVAATQAPRPAGAPAPSSSAQPARTVVLFVDTLHLSPVSLARAKTELKHFVDEQMTERDLVAVVATSGTLGVLQQFTRDRRVLKYAIDKLSLFPGERTAVTPYLASRVVAGDPEATNEVVSILGKEEGFVSLGQQSAQAYAQMRSSQILAEAAATSRATLRALGAVSEHLAAMRGQRLLAFVSDGFSLYDEGGSTDRREIERAESRAARAGVLIYAIYPKGLVGPNDLTSGPVPGEVEGGKYFMESLTDVQSNLREVAYSTGGDAYLNTNDLRAPMKKMLDANRVYYSLAYYLPKDSDRKFRKITVRVKGHPEYSVRTERGYAPPEKEADALAATTPRQKLVAAMMSPLPSTDIGVTSEADFLVRDGDDSQVTLQVHIDGDTLSYEKRGDAYALDCELAATVLDKDGNVAASFADALKGTLSAAQYEEARRNGFRYDRRIALKPGLYQARVGVREVGSERIGTSAAWVEVPDIDQGKPALSSIFMGKVEQPDAAAGAKAGAQAGADVKAGAGAKTGTDVKAGADAKPIAVAPRLVVGRATFRPGDVVFYRLVVYNAQSLAGQQQGAQLKLEIMQGETAVYEGAWQPLGARVIRTDRKGAEAGGQLRLTLAPGVYTLRLTLKDAGSKKTVQQTTDFEVES
jgi:VWFA-related protein